MMQLGLRRHFRRLGNLQVRRSRRLCPRHRRGNHVLGGPRAWWPRSRAGWVKRWPGIEIDTIRPVRSWRSGAGEPMPGRPGSSPFKETSRHMRCFDELGADRPRFALRPNSRLEALVIPGGESTTIGLGVEREGLAEPLVDFIASGKPVLGTCAGMIMLDRDHLGVLDIGRAPQRVRSPARVVRDRAALRSTARRSTPCSSALRGWRRSGTTWRCSRRWTATPLPCARATFSPWPSTRSWAPT